MRRKLFTNVACVMALGSVWFGPAQAADLYGGPSIKDEPIYVRAPFSWTGFYVGGHAGIATGNTQGDPDLGFGPANLFSTDFDMNGALYGAHVGYNIQKGNIVFGIEGTFDGSSIKGGGPTIKSDVDAEIDTIRLGVSLKFGGPL